jgi:hypothetical protein
MWRCSQYCLMMDQYGLQYVKVLAFLKNIIIPLMTIVCTGWLELQKMNSNAEN